MSRLRHKVSGSKKPKSKKHISKSGAGQPEMETRAQKVVEKPEGKKAKRRMDKRPRKASGGPIRTVMQRANPADAGPVTGDDWSRQQPTDSYYGRVSPTAQQLFTDGTRGPMNIQPTAMEGEADR